MPKLFDPENPLVQYPYLLWPSSPFSAPPTVTDGGRAGVLGPLFKGTYRYAITALSAADGSETVASPPAFFTFNEAGHTANLSWLPAVGASGGYNIYRSLAGQSGNAVYLAGHVAQPVWRFPVPTVAFNDSVSDDGLNQSKVPPTGSQLPARWSPPSLGPLSDGTFSLSADLEFGLTLHLNSWPNAIAATWATVLNPSIIPTGTTRILFDVASVLRSFQSGAIALGNFFTGEDYVPAGESPQQAEQGALASAGNFTLTQNPFSLVAAKIGQIEFAAADFGFLECTAMLNPQDSSAPLALLMTHPRDVKPVAYDLSSMVGPGQYAFSNYSLTTGRVQATPAGQLTVSGGGFPAVAQMGIGWTNTCSGTLTGSDVLWGLENEPATFVRTHLTAAANFQFRPFAAPAGSPAPASGPYVFQVSNSDDDAIAPLTTTQLSDPITVWSVGSTDLLLSYLSSNPTVGPSPTGPQPASGLVVGTAPVQSDGTFSTTIIIPPDALPGPATLCAQIRGQSVICVPLTIVTKIETLLRLVDPVSLVDLETTSVYEDYAAAVAGEGFSPPAHGTTGTVSVYIDQVEGPSIAPPAPVGADGTFVCKFTWPRVLAPGAHTLIAVETLSGNSTMGTLEIFAQELG
jgi:hypothetical protein